MSLSFFADQCVPLQIVQSLRTHGYNVVLLREYLPTNAVDTDVIAKAQELGLILLSLNGDFADIVTYPPANYLGIVCLQVKNHPETVPAIVANLAAYAQSTSNQGDFKGKLLVVDQSRVRVRS